MINFLINAVTAIKLHRSDLPKAQGYRKAGDPLHYIRFRQSQPVGSKLLVGDCEIAGTSHDPQRRAMKKFARGRYRKIELIHDPHNRFDRNAIIVIGVWKGWIFRHRRQIGFVPAHIAKMLSSKRNQNLILTATLDILFLPRLGKSSGGRIQIWGASHQ